MMESAELKIFVRNKREISTKKLTTILLTWFFSFHRISSLLNAKIYDDTDPNMPPVHLRTSCVHMNTTVPIFSKSSFEIEHM